MSLSSAEFDGIFSADELETLSGIFKQLDQSDVGYIALQDLVGWLAEQGNSFPDGSLEQQFQGIGCVDCNCITARDFITWMAHLQGRLPPPTCMTETHNSVSCSSGDQRAEEIAEHNKPIEPHSSTVEESGKERMLVSPDDKGILADQNGAPFLPNPGDPRQQSSCIATTDKDHCFHHTAFQTNCFMCEELHSTLLSEKHGERNEQCENDMSLSIPPLCADPLLNTDDAAAGTTTFKAVVAAGFFLRQNGSTPITAQSSIASPRGSREACAAPITAQSGIARSDHSDSSNSSEHYIPRKDSRKIYGRAKVQAVLSDLQRRLTPSTSSDPPSGSADSTKGKSVATPQHVPRPKPSSVSSPNPSFHSPFRVSINSQIVDHQHTPKASLMSSPNQSLVVPSPSRSLRHGVFQSSPSDTVQSLNSEQERRSSWCHGPRKIESHGHGSLSMMGSVSMTSVSSDMDVPKLRFDPDASLGSSSFSLLDLGASGSSCPARATDPGALLKARREFLKNVGIRRASISSVASAPSDSNDNSMQTFRRVADLIVKSTGSLLEHHSACASARSSAQVSPCVDKHSFSQAHFGKEAGGSSPSMDTTSFCWPVAGDASVSSQSSSNQGGLSFMPELAEKELSLDSSILLVRQSHQELKERAAETQRLNMPKYIAHVVADSLRQQIPDEEKTDLSAEMLVRLLHERPEFDLLKPLKFSNELQNIHKTVSGRLGSEIEALRGEVGRLKGYISSSHSTVSKQGELVKQLNNETAALFEASSCKEVHLPMDHALCPPAPVETAFSALQTSETAVQQLDSVYAQTVAIVRELSTLKACIENSNSTPQRQDDFYATRSSMGSLSLSNTDGSLSLAASLKAEIQGLQKHVAALSTTLTSKLVVDSCPPPSMRQGAVARAQAPVDIVREELNNLSSPAQQQGDERALSIEDYKSLHRSLHGDIATSTVRSASLSHSEPSSLKIVLQECQQQVAALSVHTATTRDLVAQEIKDTQLHGDSSSCLSPSYELNEVRALLEATLDLKASAGKSDVQSLLEAALDSKIAVSASASKTEMHAMLDAALESTIAADAALESTVSALERSIASRMQSLPETAIAHEAVDPSSSSQQDQQDQTIRSSFACQWGQGSSKSLCQSQDSAACVQDGGLTIGSLSLSPTQSMRFSLTELLDSQSMRFSLTGLLETQDQVDLSKPIVPESPLMAWYQDQHLQQRHDLASPGVVRSDMQAMFQAALNVRTTSSSSTSSSAFQKETVTPPTRLAPDTLVTCEASDLSSPERDRTVRFNSSPSFMEDSDSLSDGPGELDDGTLTLGDLLLSPVSTWSSMERACTSSAAELEEHQQGTSLLSTGGSGPHHRRDSDSSLGRSESRSFLEAVLDLKATPGASSSLSPPMETDSMASPARAEGCQLPGTSEGFRLAESPAIWTPTWPDSWGDTHAELLTIGSLSLSPPTMKSELQNSQLQTVALPTPPITGNGVMGEGQAHDRRDAGATLSPGSLEMQALLNETLDLKVVADRSAALSPVTDKDLVSPCPALDTPVRDGTCQFGSTPGMEDTLRLVSSQCFSKSSDTNNAKALLEAALDLKAAAASSFGKSGVQSLLKAALDVEARDASFSRKGAIQVMPDAGLDSEARAAAHTRQGDFKVMLAGLEVALDDPCSPTVQGMASRRSGLEAALDLLKASTLSPSMFSPSMLEALDNLATDQASSPSGLSVPNSCVPIEGSHLSSPSGDHLSSEFQFRVGKDQGHTIHSRSASRFSFGDSSSLTQSPGTPPANDDVKAVLEAALGLRIAGSSSTRLSPRMEHELASLHGVAPNMPITREVNHRWPVLETEFPLTHEASHLWSPPEKVSSMLDLSEPLFEQKAMTTCDMFRQLKMQTEELRAHAERTEHLRDAALQTLRSGTRLHATTGSVQFASEPAHRCAAPPRWQLRHKLRHRTTEGQCQQTLPQPQFGASH